MQTFTFTRPDDWHLHLRDGAAMRDVLPDTVQRFARAIIMPNLKPPITTVVQAMAYKQRILAASPVESVFEPLMTLYLTDNTSAQEIVKASSSDFIHGIKLYPAGATTNSDLGVSDLAKCDAALAAMEKHKMPLLVHAEMTDPEIDIFDREAVFIERHLIPLSKKFPALKIVFEHITTKEAADFVLSTSNNIAATITAHHLLMNRNAMLAGGIHPHHYCLPVLKRELHREALVAAATSGNSKFFLGTDSAPHAKSAKEAACGCAGIYSAHAAIELYAEVFEQNQSLNKLEAFASFHGADFYGLPRNQSKITLLRERWMVASDRIFGDQVLVPLWAGKELNWKLA